MSKLILVRVPNDTDPHHLVIDPGVEDLNIVVCGVWQEPPRFCECTSNRDSGYTLGQKFGWWVHSACRRPRIAWRNKLGSALFQALGKNQLENAPEEFRYDPSTPTVERAKYGAQVRN